MLGRVERQHDIKNVVKELGKNRVDPLEVIREAMSNARDHGAKRFWIQTHRANPRQGPSVVFIDDGDGMDEQRLSAFWSVGASVKAAPGAIGYKGHGTKLFYDARRLSVVTRVRESDPWACVSVDRPSELGPQASLEINLADPQDVELLRGLDVKTGTLIRLSEVEFESADRLLDRTRIESYCDWFTVLGDVRSGLFRSRKEFHQVVLAGPERWADLAVDQVPLRPVDVWLRVNGEPTFTRLWSTRNYEYLRAWGSDLDEHQAGAPHILAFGHRFADHFLSEAGARRVTDDSTALTLTTPSNWLDEGYGTILRVEGYRRQRLSYTEASWQNHSGAYRFEDRFGLWLCRDFLPIAHCNDLLQEAIDQASNRRLRFELGRLRNWKIFINHQDFLPTANRDDLANLGQHRQQIIASLKVHLERAFKANAAFEDWVERMRVTSVARRRDTEIGRMNERRAKAREWARAGQQLDAARVTALAAREPDEAFPLPHPSSEQELFYLYAVLSARYQVPLRVIEYDATEGIDAVAKATPEGQRLLTGSESYARVEFKFRLVPGRVFDHFFDAVDVVVCWEVERPGDIDEDANGGITGTIKRRAQPQLVSGLDTHEIEYSRDGATRRIPVVTLATLFATGS